jgi:hypothetical protein
MKAAALLVVLALAAPGCIQLVGGQAKAFDDCQPVSTPFVISANYHGGYTPPDLLRSRWTLDADGALVFYQGTHQPGSGRVTAAPGALDNVTTSVVTTRMQQAGDWSAHRDYTIERAYMATGSTAHLERICTLILNEFYDTEARYNKHPDLADGATLRIAVDTSLGRHASEAYSADGSDAYNAVRDALYELDGQVERDAAAA